MTYEEKAADVAKEIVITIINGGGFNAPADADPVSRARKLTEVVNTAYSSIYDTAYQKLKE